VPFLVECAVQFGPTKLGVKYEEAGSLERYLPRQSNPSSLLCKRQARCFGRIEPINVKHLVSGVWVRFQERTHQVQIILHEILLEPIQGKRTLAQARNKLVMGKLLPNLLNIRAIQNVFDESTAENSPC
jgi:hypothetical protein